MNSFYISFNITPMLTVYLLFNPYLISSIFIYEEKLKYEDCSYNELAQLSHLICIKG